MDEEGIQLLLGLFMAFVGLLIVLGILSALFHGLAAALKFAIRFCQQLLPSWPIWIKLEKFINGLFDHDRHYVRGAKVISTDLANSHCRNKRKRNDQGIEFGDTKQPTPNVNDHFLFMGGPGTGKTTNIRLLLQDLLSLIYPGSRLRALLYDPKLEMVPQLCSPGTQLKVPLIISNPFDKRSMPWDIAADVVDMPTAREVARLLVPDVGKQDGNAAFFTSTSRRLLSGVMRALMHHNPKKWTFTDVLIACDDPDRLKAVLESFSGTKSLIPKLCAKEATFQDIYATLCDRIDSFREVAAIYRASKHKNRPLFSLNEWSRGESILLLGNDKTRGEVLDPLNRVFFHLAAKFTTQPRKRRSSKNRTLFVIDEVQQAGRLDGLNDLLTTGRSYGVTVVLGCQSRDGLEKPGMFSKEEANEIVEQCGHRMIARVNDKTANWASELIGKAIRWESDGHQGIFGVSTHGQKDTMKLVERAVVLPATFQQLSDMKHQQMFHAYCYSPTTQFWWECEVPSKKLFAKLHQPSTQRKHAGFIPRSPKDMDESLLVWSDAEAKRLGLGAKQDPKPPSKLPTVEIPTDVNRPVPEEPPIEFEVHDPPIVIDGPPPEPMWDEPDFVPRIIH